MANWPVRSVATPVSLAILIGLAAGGCAATPRPADLTTRAMGRSAPATPVQGQKIGLDQVAHVGLFKSSITKKPPTASVSGACRLRPRFESQGKLDAAINEYQDALTVIENRRYGPFRPSDGPGPSADRQAHGSPGPVPQAETHYKKALKLSPKDPKIWNDAGYSYYLQGRLGRRRASALKTASRLAPDDQRIRSTSA